PVSMIFNDDESEDLNVAESKSSRNLAIIKSNPMIDCCAANIFWPAARGSCARHLGSLMGSAT
ncbi:MAG: hypothetical protein PV344_05490, partial [Anaplasma sp.]|nr:hypothetical protein [Anaplasma sp.]